MVPVGSLHVPAMGQATNAKADGGRHVHAKLTANIEREGTDYVALYPGVGAASQGNTDQEARSNLPEALALLSETFSDSEIAHRLRSEVYVARAQESKRKRS